MTGFVKKSLVAGGVVCLAMIGSLMDSGRAVASQVQDVNVVSPLPLTVQGTVSAAQSGEWSVSVGNTGAKPVPVYNIDAIARVPYQKIVTRTGQCTGLTNCDFSFGNVPANHRLVIQHVTGVNVLNGPPAKVSVYAQNFGYPVMQFFAPFSDTSVEYDHNTLFYLDAGAPIFVTVAAGPQTFAGGNFAQIATLTGYLIDCSVASCAAIVQ